MQPRLRIIAGPNGSGKTTLTSSIREKLGGKFGIYVNADDIEQGLKKTQTLDFRIYGLIVSADGFRQFYMNHPLYPRAAVSWTIIENLFVLKSPIANGTYFPTLFADFIRETLLEQKASFAFETVMSDKGKIELLMRAQQMGYRTYLYYVCLDDPLVNVDRVAGRVLNKGHDVPTDKILKRYIRSLENLTDAIKNTSRTYLYDNSGIVHELVAEITDGHKIVFDTAFVPFWFEDYVLSKVGKTSQ